MTCEIVSLNAGPDSKPALMLTSDCSECRSMRPHMQALDAATTAEEKSRAFIAAWEAGHLLFDAAHSLAWGMAIGNAHDAANRRLGFRSAPEA